MNAQHINKIFANYAAYQALSSKTMCGYLTDLLT